MLEGPSHGGPDCPLGTIAAIGLIVWWVIYCWFYI